MADPKVQYTLSQQFKPKKYQIEKEIKMEIILIKSFTDKPWRSPETYQLIEECLRENWKVTSISINSSEYLNQFLEMLKRKHSRDLFVFNIAEYVDESRKEGFLPDILENLGIRHLGSSSNTVKIGLDKIKTKEILLDHQIPTPEYFVATPDDHHLWDQAGKIGYPLFVKPVFEGGHIGIGDDSIVYNDKQLEQAVQRIHDKFKQPALVERFLTGEGMREFSVGVLDFNQRLFTPVEIDYASMPVKNAILSHQAAVNDLEKVKLVNDKAIEMEIVSLAEKAFAAISARDYSRVDLRMDKTGMYVLEINIMPGLGPHSFLPEAAEAIYQLGYRKLIQNLVTASMDRQT